MSHCTTFELSFRDKRLVFRALRNLGLQPHNQVWKRFRSEIHKQFGVQGEDLGKLLTGTDGIVHIIFIETAEGLQPMIESSKLQGEELGQRGYWLVSHVQAAYLRCAVEEAVRQYSQSGLHAEMEEVETADGVSLRIRFGHSHKTITVTQQEDGTIIESVQGIEGSSCTVASSVIEGLVANQASLQRTWQPEYSTVIEDRMIQVLMLARP